MSLQKYKPEVNTLLPGDERSDKTFAPNVKRDCNRKLAVGYWRNICSCHFHASSKFYSEYHISNI